MQWEPLDSLRHIPCHFPTVYAVLKIERPIEPGTSTWKASFLFTAVVRSCGLCFWTLFRCTAMDFIKACGLASLKAVLESEAVEEYVPDHTHYRYLPPLITPNGGWCRYEHRIHEQAQRENRQKARMEGSWSTRSSAREPLPISSAVFSTTSSDARMSTRSSIPSSTCRIDRAAELAHVVEATTADPATSVQETRETAPAAPRNRNIKATDMPHEVATSSSEETLRPTRTRMKSLKRRQYLVPVSVDIAQPIPTSDPAIRASKARLRDIEEGVSSASSVYASPIDVAGSPQLIGSISTRSSSAATDRAYHSARSGTSAGDKSDVRHLRAGPPRKATPLQTNKEHLLATIETVPRTTVTPPHSVTLSAAAPSSASTPIPPLARQVIPAGDGRARHIRDTSLELASGGEVRTQPKLGISDETVERRLCATNATAISLSPKNGVGSTIQHGAQDLKKAKGIVPRTGPPVPEVVDANHINAMSKEGWRSGSLRSVLGSVAPTDEKNPQTTSSLTDTKPHCPVMPSANFCGRSSVHEDPSVGDSSLGARTVLENACADGTVRLLASAQTHPLAVLESTPSAQTAKDGGPTLFPTYVPASIFTNAPSGKSRLPYTKRTKKRPSLGGLFTSSAGILKPGPPSATIPETVPAQPKLDEHRREIEQSATADGAPEVDPRTSMLVSTDFLASTAGSVATGQTTEATGSISSHPPPIRRSVVLDAPVVTRASGAFSISGTSPAVDALPMRVHSKRSTHAVIVAPFPSAEIRPMLDKAQPEDIFASGASDARIVVLASNLILNDDDVIVQYIPAPVYPVLLLETILIPHWSVPDQEHSAEDKMKTIEPVLSAALAAVGELVSFSSDKLVSGNAVLGPDPSAVEGQTAKALLPTSGDHNAGAHQSLFSVITEVPEDNPLQEAAADPAEKGDHTDLDPWAGIGRSRKARSRTEAHTPASHVVPATTTLFSNKRADSTPNSEGRADTSIIAFGRSLLSDLSPWASKQTDATNAPPSKRPRTSTSGLF